MRVNEKIERITPDTLICGIDVGKQSVVLDSVITEDWRYITKFGLIKQKILMR